MLRKSMEAEAVFTEIEINEMFIFFTIQAVWKKYDDWSCIYQERNEQEGSINFLQNTRFENKYGDLSCIQQKKGILTTNI